MDDDNKDKVNKLIASMDDKKKDLEELIMSTNEVINSLDNKILGSWKHGGR